MKTEAAARNPDHSCILLTNGLGGYASVTQEFGVSRCDQGILIGAVRAPNERITMVHRLREVLQLPDGTQVLSGQLLADGSREPGGRFLESFQWEPLPVWTYRIGGLRVTRTMAAEYGWNRTAVCYEVENSTETACTLQVEPMHKFLPKEQALTGQQVLSCRAQTVCCGERRLWIRTDGLLQAEPPRWEMLAYPEDARDGRPGQGMAGSCCRILRQIPAGETGRLTMVFSMDPPDVSGEQILDRARSRQRMLREHSGFRDPTARRLAAAADAYIARRDSTGGKTILAGYPLFSDWGRDTMIALPGCCLATGRFEDAREILRTFLAYEKDGLVPNLFPEGGQEPLYNTVDAALLLIDGVWQYVKTSGDRIFIREAFPVLQRIVRAYRSGTRHGIRMDRDGLIWAGQGQDQVTWMDVCVDGILPTPRHGKPVEVNAYWYRALCVLARMARELGTDAAPYETLARQVRESFVREFYLEDRGYLRDVISGTDADLQIRCNQIWAVSMEDSMLTRQQEKQVVETVRRHLWTPRGLRSLSNRDPQFHPFYGGSQRTRDLAYHQGTVWVFPLGAYYRAWLKVHDYSAEAAADVRMQLREVVQMLQEGCAGQLPEIYDGAVPAEGRGCYAQAWSVGELLRVYEILEKIERGEPCGTDHTE